MKFDDQLDGVLKLERDHPCYKQWRDYHLKDSERGEAVASFLDSDFGLKDAEVLDIGCGLGGLAIQLASRSALVFGVEPEQDKVCLATLRAQENSVANVQFLIGNGEHLPFPNSKFDVVTMNDVVEHFSSPVPAIAEAARVLKRGGHIYVLAPNRASLSVTLRDPHYRLPFVVWMPQQWRDAAVRLLGRGDHYDGNWFPTIGELVEVFRGFGIELQQVGYFQYDRPHLIRATAWNKFINGYPVFIGVKVREGRWPLL